MALFDLWNKLVIFELEEKNTYIYHLWHFISILIHFYWRNIPFSWYKKDSNTATFQWLVWINAKLCNRFRSWPSTRVFLDYCWMRMLRGKGVLYNYLRWYIRETQTPLPGWLRAAESHNISWWGLDIWISQHISERRFFRKPVGGFFVIPIGD